MRVQHDDSIIQDVLAERTQDTAEAGIAMNAWEYREMARQDEKTAKARARGLRGAGSCGTISPEN